jgi:hypothetical protein
MSFQQKYLKYKSKYINLKNKLNNNIFMMGGGEDSSVDGLPERLSSLNESSTVNLPNVLTSTEDHTNLKGGSTEDSSESAPESDSASNTSESQATESDSSSD